MCGELEREDFITGEAMRRLVVHGGKFFMRLCLSRR
jgi:hypothetical protein